MKKLQEQPVRILWKDGYDLHWVKAGQLISHIDHIFELKEQIAGLRRLSSEDFYEYVLSYRSIPDFSLIDFSDGYAAFMNKYLSTVNKDPCRKWF